MTKILIVEDDQDFGNLLVQYLNMNQFDAKRVFNGKEARLKLESEQFDLFLVDVMMPEEDGFTFAEKVRKTHPKTPFLFLTAKNHKGDIHKGLKLGAEDYITKPFDADELVLRIQNILKRSGLLESSDKEISIGNLTLNTETNLLSWTNGEHRLTQKECELLAFLSNHRNKIVKRDIILNAIWKESDFFSGRSMDVFITKLRKHLKHDPNVKIESVRGLGIKLVVE